MFNYILELCIRLYNFTQQIYNVMTLEEEDSYMNFHLFIATVVGFLKFASNCVYEAFSELTHYLLSTQTQ